MRPKELQRIMEEANFYTDIKESVNKLFYFLQSDFQFSGFVERQLAQEIHFEAKNDLVAIDIWFEATTSTPIWAKVNDYYIDNLEPENKKIKEYYSDLKENYDKLFEQYLNTKKVEYLEEISNQYALVGKKINDKYLKELSEILKRHTSVLNGDFDLLAANTKAVIENNEKRIDNERIKKGLYTIEYQFFSVNEGEFDAYQEFEDITEIKPFLVARPEIKVYRILNCYMNEISLKELD